MVARLPKPEAEPERAEGETDGRTIFVKNLTKDVTNDALTTLLGEAGTVLSCFIVRDENGDSKGFGYTKFASAEEASACIDRFDGHEWQGLRLKLTAAKPRRRLGDKPAHEDVSECKSVLLSNVPLVYDNRLDALEKWINSVIPSAGLAAVTLHLKGANALTAELSFKKSKNATRVLASLNGAGIRGSKQRLGCELKAMAHQSGSSRQGRLMVRNLSFGAKVDDLKALFNEHGEVSDVHIPMNGTKPRGFGFVEFKARADAEKAIAGLNGKKLKGRAIAVDFAVDARVYQALKTLAVPEKPETAITLPSKILSDDGEDDDEEDDEDAVQRDEMAKEQAKIAAAEDKIEKDEKAEKEKRASGFDVEQNQTIFVRNVPFEATEDNVKDAFQKFGKIAFVKLVKTKTSVEGALADAVSQQRHKGVGFVKFRTEEGCKAALADEERTEEQLRQLSCATRRGKRESVVMEGFGVTVMGRRVHILKALKPGEAQNESDNRKAKVKETKHKWDHLLELGNVVRGSEEAKGLSENDLRLREASMKERRFKMTNPNYQLNPLRLSIRNLPKKVQSGELKTSCMQLLRKKLAKKVALKSIVKAVIATDKDAETGELSSRGFGFVDFKDHEHALALLELLNNSENAPWGNKRRPIVEFAMDDKRKLHVQAQAKEKFAKAVQEKKDRGEWWEVDKRAKFDKKEKAGKDDSEQPKALGRGAKQRAKRRAAREEAERKKKTPEGIKKAERDATQVKAATQLEVMSQKLIEEKFAKDKAAKKARKRGLDAEVVQAVQAEEPPRKLPKRGQGETRRKKTAKAKSFNKELDDDFESRMLASWKA